MSFNPAISKLASVCPSDWDVLPMPEVTFFQEGPGILAKDFRDSGVPLLRLKSVEGDYVTLNGCNFLDPAMVKKKWDHFRVEEGDLLISTSASLGRVSEVTSQSSGGVPYTGLIRFKPKDGRLKHSYLKAFLGSAAFIDQALSMASGSVIQHFGPTHIKQMGIIVPPIRQQEEIGDFAALFDERLRILRQTNATLEAIAQVIFKSWFIDFDPVRAKSKGLAPEGMEEATAALFPDSLEESELGPIPRGWSAGTLADLAALNPESWTAKSQPEQISYVDLANAKDNEITASEALAFDEAPSRARRVLRSGDTIVGTVRPGNRSFAFIHDPVKNLTGSTGFAVLRPKQVATTEFVFLAATQDASIDRLTHLADGAAYPAVRPDVVTGLSCVLPSEGVLNAFHSLCEPMLTYICANQRESQTLAELRDVLLPRLISGKLRIPEAKELIEAIAA